jgi:hypothetical protein
MIRSRWVYIILCLTFLGVGLAGWVLLIGSFSVVHSGSSSWFLDADALVSCFGSFLALVYLYVGYCVSDLRG